MEPRVYEAVGTRKPFEFHFSARVAEGRCSVDVYRIGAKFPFLKLDMAVEAGAVALHLIGDTLGEGLTDYIFPTFAKECLSGKHGKFSASDKRVFLGAVRKQHPHTTVSAQEALRRMERRAYHRAAPAFLSTPIKQEWGEDYRKDQHREQLRILRDMPKPCLP